MQHEDRLVSTTEAARLAHVSVGSIQHWMRTGRLAPCGVLPRSKQAKRVRPEVTGKYTRHQFRLADVLAASFEQRMRQLKSEYKDLNLLTVREIAIRCNRTEAWVYQIVKKFELERYYIDRWVYMVSGATLWEKFQEDPTYAQLFLKL
jgi:hypothetical protein